MTVMKEHLVVILFVVAIIGIAFDMLVALFLLFRDQQQSTKKPAKRFLLLNWK
jgi:hypothetical protein